MARILNRTCPHCGTTGQLFIEYAEGWEAECLQCSCIIPVKGISYLNPAKFTSVGIQSPSQVHSNYKIPFGGTNIHHLYGNKQGGI
jgi:hypothetical protein